jgi:hypothetical protein
VEEENGSDDELDLEQVEEEMAAQYASDEEEYDDSAFNINNVKTITPHANAVRAEVLESNADAEAWRMEVERVIPRLKLAMKAGSKKFLNCRPNTILSCFNLKIFIFKIWSNINVENFRFTRLAFAIGNSQQL